MCLWMEEPTEIIYKVVLPTKKSSLLQLPIHRGTKNVKRHLKDSISKIQALQNSIGEATLFHQQYQKLKKKNGGGTYKSKET